MSFDAGQFFNNLFNNVGKIGKVNSENEIKLKYNPEIANDAKILPDETPDEKVIVSEKMLMYAVPDFKKEDITVEKYAIVRPDTPDDTPKPTMTVEKYAIVRPDIPEDTPKPTDITVEKYAIVRPDPTIEEPIVKPDNPGIYKYAVPSVTPTAEEPVVPMYAVPDPEPVPSPAPTGIAPVLKYAMPTPEPMPVPTQPTYIPTPQPTIPHNPVNPWRINIPQIITNLFGNNGSSFAMRVNNAFANFFSRLR